MEVQIVDKEDPKGKIVYSINLNPKKAKTFIDGMKQILNPEEYEIKTK